MLPSYILFAQVQDQASTNWNVLIVGLGALCILLATVLAIARHLGGKSGERQVEPTALAALSQKIDDAMAERPDIAREMGSMTAQLENLIAELAEQRKVQREDIARAHQRIDAISEGLSSTTARVTSLERNCARC